jgi:antirestriction protein ArdC
MTGRSTGQLVGRIMIRRCDSPRWRVAPSAPTRPTALVAELGAVFLCAELGITVEPRLDHVQYLAHWLTVRKADERAIFTAASKAAEAAAYLHNDGTGIAHGRGPQLAAGS